MLGTSVYSFSACICGTSSEGRIERKTDGASITITEQELPDLLLDLAADGSGMPGRAKHHHQVLGEWFARKTSPMRPSLRLVG